MLFAIPFYSIANNARGCLSAVILHSAPLQGRTSAELRITSDHPRALNIVRQVVEDADIINELFTSFSKKKGLAKKL
ncbi:hypothetical protein J7J13_01390 [bacterium]|nr:hypothetical protein [bacterium]